ncbi:MAG: PEGA domain-containing protein [Acidobacteria bacterium]|nr:PEGA domain-containing protein [Acidobacteriota bacterium]
MSSRSGGSGAARTRTPAAREHSRRGHGRSSHGHFGRSYFGYPSYSFLYSGYWGYWGWNLGYGYGPGYGYGSGYGYYPPVVYSSRQGYGMGALDLNVKPKQTEIYVDGQYVGLARQYDGFPGHLWLERGVYEISFYKPGFETETRTVKILTNLVLDMHIEMLPGEATKPEMLFRPGEQEENDSDEVARRSWRGGGADLHGRLHLEVEPGNAVVYLDGNVLGTGDELAALHAGLILSPGTHTLEVVRRGFETVERKLIVEPGAELEFVLMLKPVERVSG